MARILLLSLWLLSALCQAREPQLPSLEQVLQVTHTTERTALLRTLVEKSPYAVTRAVAGVRLLEVHLLLRQQAAVSALLERIDVSLLDRNDRRLVQRLQRSTTDVP